MYRIMKFIKSIFPSRHTKRKKKTQKRGKSIMFSESNRIRKSAINMLEMDLRKQANQQA